MTVRLRFWAALAFVSGYQITPVIVHTAFGIHIA